MHRNTARQDIMPVSIRAFEALLSIPACSGLDAFFPIGNRGFNIIGMQEVSPAVNGTIFLSNAQQSQKRITGVSVPAGRVADPYSIVYRFANRAITPLTFQHFRLMLLPFTDVTKNEHTANHVSADVPDGGDRTLNGPFRPVIGNQDTIL